MSGRDAFVARYGGIYEHSAWVAERAFERVGPDADEAAIRRAMATSVDAADDTLKLALVRAHPDLAGRAALRGELTADSTAEQRSAGIDQCTADELERFRRLNARYKDKFGFPFVMAVAGRHRREILAAFEARVENTPQDEFATALAEIHKIAALRLAELARANGSNDD